jgi:hypothetical protein
MAKDYFQDILPPEGGEQRRPVAPLPKIEPDAVTSVPINNNMNVTNGNTNITNSSRPVTPPPPEGERSIRNISMPQRGRPRPMSDMREGSIPPGMSSRKSVLSRWWIWIAAGVSILVLGVLVVVAMRATTVTVIPRSHAITFDPSTQFTAYPSSTPASGTLAYTVQTADFEDSDVVATSGTTTHSEVQASGTITVYNNYQSTPFKLIKNTRFESSTGLIFRTPAEIIVPGKKGGVPGQVSVTVIADQAGDQYNVPAGKFTVPGLKSSAQLYAGIYAQSVAAMTGGFIGDVPGVAPGAKESAVSAIRSRLEAKARSGVTPSADSVVFPDLIQITYQDAPDTTEAGGGIRVHESAHVVIPVFSASAFATVVSADVNDSPVTLVPSTGLTAQIMNASSTLGVDPLQFTLSGSAKIIWNVDTAGLATALAGKNQNAFQAIVTQFPGVQEAHARIEPFWKNTFPTNPTAIKIDVQAPTI